MTFEFRKLPGCGGRGAIALRKVRRRGIVQFIFRRHGYFVALVVGGCQQVKFARHRGREIFLLQEDKALRIRKEVKGENDLTEDASAFVGIRFQVTLDGAAGAN
jgi:hypothetical protein